MKKYILICSIFLITSCQKYNKLMFETNKDTFPLTEKIITGYGNITPEGYRILLLNSYNFSYRSLFIPLKILKTGNVLKIYKKFMVDLFIGGFGSIPISNICFEEEDYQYSSNRYIILPFITNPISIISLSSNIILYYSLNAMVPSAIVNILLINTILSTEYKNIQQTKYILEQDLPYQDSLKLFKTKRKYEKSVTFPLVD